MATRRHATDTATGDLGLPRGLSIGRPVVFLLHGKAAPLAEAGAAHILCAGCPADWSSPTGQLRIWGWVFEAALIGIAKSLRCAAPFQVPV